MSFRTNDCQQIVFYNGLKNEPDRRIVFHIYCNSQEICNRSNDETRTCNIEGN